MSTACESRKNAAEGPTPQVTDLSVAIRSDEAVFRLMALLHRKHVTVVALIWLPSDRHRKGRRLRLAIISARVPANHVIMLMRQVVGVMEVQAGTPGTHTASMPI